MSNKPKIVVFGASKGGERFLRRCGNAYDVLAFSDNDPAKHGSSLSGIPVLPPDRIPDFPFDLVVVASMFGREIKDQLVRRFSIPPDRIRFAPKSALSPDKSYRPFEDEPTRDLARRMLGHFADLFRNARIPYFVDHGTLLGIFRDGDLLPWDDDLDLSVPSEFAADALAALRDARSSLPHAGVLDWSAETIADADSGLVQGVVLCYPEQNPLRLRKFAASVWFMFRSGDSIRQYINLAPARFYDRPASLAFLGQNHPVPSPTSEYLELHYGDWKTPVRDLSLEEIRNYRPPPPRIRREVLFGTPSLS